MDQSMSLLNFRMNARFDHARREGTMGSGVQIPQFVADGSGSTREWFFIR